MRSACIAAMMLLALGAWRAPAAIAPAPAGHHHDMAGMEDMPPTADIPGSSLYQLPATLQGADGESLRLADLRGQPLLVAMFYSHCTSVCPLLTSQLQRLFSALSPAAQHRTRVLMVSFDSHRDTPAVLADFRALHHIEGDRWLVARASAADVRALAAALGIRYRELPDHSFNHSAVITLLDRDGVPRARTEVIATEDPGFLASIENLPD